MSRILRGFDRLGESLVFEYAMPQLDLGELQRAFEVPEGDPMFDSFRVGPAQADFVAKTLSIELNFDRYDYFVEFEAD